MSFTITGNIVDIFSREIYPGEIFVNDGIIVYTRKKNCHSENYILPGFIDAHIHVESSMLPPSEFARVAVTHGTVATVSDPHEIANVLGVKGVKYMLKDARKVNFKFYFGAPSCVPATHFETSGAEISAGNIDELFQNGEISYLAEFMNWPGVIHNDPVCLEKLSVAKKFGLPIDGHAPGLRGEQARKYIQSGISTDHECFTQEEALDKLKYGMKIIIREGSAAKNFSALAPLIDTHPEQLMFCSDDKHPDDFLLGHINKLVARSVSLGKNLFDVLRISSWNPAQHYRMNTGFLREGDPADFIIVDDLKNFNVLQTYIDGKLVAENGNCLIPAQKPVVVNNFNCNKTKPGDFKIKANYKKMNVIEALDEQLITRSTEVEPLTTHGEIISDTQNDVLKIIVLNRYKPALPSIAFIKNFGLKRGAIASSVAHDCHNIIAVGVDDFSISRACNLVIQEKGGISLVDGKKEIILGLPIAGIMSTKPVKEVAAKYQELDKAAKNLGSKLKAPYMTLSFMALLVIPELKLSDKGLFDGKMFCFKELFIK